MTKPYRYTCEWCGGDTFHPSFDVLRCVKCGIYINVPKDFKFKVISEDTNIRGDVFRRAEDVEAEADRRIWWREHEEALWGKR